MDVSDRENWRKASRESLERFQLGRLNDVLAHAATNPFYQASLSGVDRPLKTLSQLAELPIVSKRDLIADQPGQPGRIYCLPMHRYTRMHQTSGTLGWPMPVLDTDDDWQWWLDCWQYVLDAGDVTPSDVALMAFSFGPFIGFWTANDALVQRGALVIPSGGMSSETRLQLIEDHRCTIVCCTPTYALHVASVAARNGVDLAASTVTRLIVAGEPGGSIPAVRSRIEEAWGASVVDHTGASELGAWGFGSSDGRGIHVIESEFIAEVLRFDDDHPNGIEAAEGEEAELVMTNLGRYGGPVIRYRTGDVVRAYRNHDHPCRFMWLDGGVIGRADDMLVIRGVNVFPSSIEAIVREIDPIAEFRMIVSSRDEMDQLSLEVEMTEEQAKHLSKLLRERLSLRVQIDIAPGHSFDRFEAKARRVVDRRSTDTAKGSERL